MDKLNQVAVKNNKLEKYYSLKGNFGQKETMIKIYLIR